MGKKAILIIMATLIVVTGLFGVLGISIVAETDTTTEVIYPSDDSWVSKAELLDYKWYNTSDWNYGNRTGLAVTTTTVDERDRRAFLKFSLSSLSSPENIDSVKLSLFRNDYTPPAWGQVGNVEATEVADDSWTEETITWNNQPTYGNPLDVVSVFNINQWYSWNVTPFVKNELTGDSVVSICLKAENEDGGSTFRYSAFWSKEYDGFDPHLLVTYEPTPIAAMLDIRPDTLKLRNKGQPIKAYIELPEGYDVGDIDVSTILLNNTVPAISSRVKANELVARFDRTEVITLLSVGEVTLTITGEVNGTPFEGSDTVIVK